MLHVITRAAWALAEPSGRIARPPGGFIHLCTEAQLDFVLTRHFAGRDDLMLLTLNPADLDIRWEASESAMPPFPHLYDDLRVESVIGTRAL